MKFETFSDLLKSPLSVKKQSGEIVKLSLDPSAEPDLYIVDDPPVVNDVPVALIDLSDGGGAFVRFDSWPPRYSRLHISGYGQRVSKDKFVRRVNALLAAV